MEQMGNNVGYYNNLTDDDKAILCTSWGKIRNDPSKSGANLFIVVFAEFPKMSTYFPFRGPQEDAFEQHMTVLVKEIDRLIQNIENPKELCELLLANANSHAPRNISKDDYLKLKNGVLKMLRAQLGTDTFTKDIEKVWDKSLTLAFTFLVENSAMIKTKKSIH